MDFTSQDIVMIEKALHTAIQHETSEHTRSELREVLRKLQTSSQAALTAEATSAAPMDGFRYDYDDSADLV
ncbi:hypothetical protein SD70_15095 [Gordoniibacillus kamchatkensis]|uniref:Uncharacterized protein n=1 Tax=Gordoniibacillus kamchatkensis TaxID=1590651 RepID=A0ABR5AGT4_9BACL|nr:hypothetical protein [Paenibacillus sp. VKM B-2647]KIL40160.1 hypothetical protein SD70_15095 [Paenibacillus sp. VKM B-2647]